MITRHPDTDLTGALEDTPPSADTIRKAGTLTAAATNVEGLYRVGAHRVHLGRNHALCDCEASRHGRVCSHVLAVVTHTGWTPPERPKVTVPDDPFEGLV